MQNLSRYKLHSDYYLFKPLLDHYKYKYGEEYEYEWWFSSVIRNRPIVKEDQIEFTRTDTDTITILFEGRFH